MSGSFLDDAAESDQFVSFPGTPTADGENAFWEGELVHDYLTF